jgi:hypothetical protein
MLPNYFVHTQGKCYFPLTWNYDYVSLFSYIFTRNFSKMRNGFSGQNVKENSQPILLATIGKSGGLTLLGVFRICHLCVS